MWGAKDGRHEKDTFFPQVIHSFTKETHLPWVTEQENKAGVLHCIAQSSAAGDRSLRRSAGNFRELHILGAPAPGPEQVCEECWPFFLSLSAPTRGNGMAAATWPPTPPFIEEQRFPKELLTSLSCPCLESFSLSLVSLALSLSWPLAQFGRYLIYYLLNRQTYPFPLLNFTTLQVLVTVITNTINHLHGSFKSTQIVYAIQQNTLVWGYFILSLVFV